MKYLAPLLAVATLCACAVTDSPSTSEADAAAGAACGADELQRLIGLGQEELLKEEILGPVRTIRPGDAVTADFMANRLNIVLDDTNTVTRVNCG
ncbi:MAG: I78 family peptidase inhibitor [Pseudomonadota bacterium]